MRLAKPSRRLIDERRDRLALGGEALRGAERRRGSRATIASERAQAASSDVSATIASRSATVTSPSGPAQSASRSSSLASRSVPSPRRSTRSRAASGSSRKPRWLASATSRARQLARLRRLVAEHLAPCGLDRLGEALGVPLSSATPPARPEPR